MFHDDCLLCKIHIFHFKAQTSPILIPVQRANSTPIFCGVGCSSKWRINIRWWFNDNVDGSLFSVWVGYSISHSSKWKIPCLFPYLITDLSTATISRTVFLANPEVHLSITNCWTSFSVIFSAAPNRGNRCVCNVSWYAHRWNASLSDVLHHTKSRKLREMFFYCSYLRELIDLTLSK